MKALYRISILSNDSGSWTRSKVRNCNDPEPKFGGKCLSENGITNESIEICLPINGGWSKVWFYESDENCKLIESKWMKERIRHCNNPIPQYGGQFCKNDAHGGNISQVECNPINGQWGNFNEWSKCNENCRTSRFRNCTNPKPAYKGKNCLGNNFEHAYCTGSLCPARKCFDTIARGKNEIDVFQINSELSLLR